MVVLVGALVEMAVPLELEFLVKETMVALKPPNLVIHHKVGLFIGVVGAVVQVLLVTIWVVAVLVCVQALQAQEFFMLAAVAVVFTKQHHQEFMV
jgi:hypothetical protein